MGGRERADLCACPNDANGHDLRQGLTQLPRKGAKGQASAPALYAAAPTSPLFTEGNGENPSNPNFYFRSIPAALYGM